MPTIVLASSFAALVSLLHAPMPVVQGFEAEETEEKLDARQRALREKAARTAKTSREFMDRARYEEALEADAARLAINQLIYDEKRYPDGHEEIVQTLLDLARSARVTLKFDQARDYGERALRMARRLFPAREYPSGHVTIARCLGQLGNVAKSQGKLDQAQALYEESVAILEQLNVKQKPSGQFRALVQDLTNLAAVLTTKRDYREALEKYKQLSKLWDHRFSKIDLTQADDNDLDLFGSYFAGLGNLHLSIGNTEKAIESHEMGVRIARILTTKSELDVWCENLVSSLFLLAKDYRLAGRRHEALENYQLALQELRKAESDWGNPVMTRLIVSCLTELASIELEGGDLWKAQGLMDEAVSRSRRMFPPEQFPHGDRALATILNRHAAISAALNDLETARSYADEALKMRRRFYSETGAVDDQIAVSVSLYELSNILDLQGDLSLAIKYSEETAAIQRKVYPREVFPKGHPQLAIALLNLMRLYSLAGDDRRAIAYGEEAVAIWRGRRSPQTPLAESQDYAIALQQLAEIYHRAGESAKAEPLFQEAFGLLGDDDGSNPASREHVASLMLRWAVLLAAKGQKGEAQELVDKSLQLVERIYPTTTFPEGLPQSNGFLVNAGIVQYASGDYSSAMATLARAVRMRNDFLFRHVCGLSEAEALNLACQAAYSRDLLVSVWRRSGEPVSAVYGSIWKQRGVVQRAISYRQRTLGLTKTAATQPLLSEHQSVSRELARMLLHAAVEKGGTTGKRLDELTHRKEGLERALASQLRAAGRVFTWEESSPEELLKELPRGCAFVDFLRYWDFSPQLAGSGALSKTTTARYLALVVKPQEAIAAVDLGQAQVIDAAALAFRRAIRSGNADLSCGESLRNLAWKPLEELLGPETTTVYLCPDSVLTSVPWGALPSRDLKKPLLEQYALPMVLSGQFLLEQLRRSEPKSNSAEGLLAVGGAAFGDQPSGAGLTGELAWRSPARHFRERSWSPLPATVREIEGISARAESRKVILLRGAEASTSRVVTELPKVRWAHFATHGYFAASEFRSAVQSITTADLDHYAFSFGRTRVSADARNPLLLSGLVLAGANLPRGSGDSVTGQEDCGILTAEAISYLPLQNLEIAVLSACETGLGDVAGGEGVLGLQRAFHIAGARNVIASLWQIDDAATCALMELFYEHLWRGGKTPLESLRQAQLALFRSPERMSQPQQERGIDLSKTSSLPASGGLGSGDEKSAKLHLWAAFVLSGVGR